MIKKINNNDREFATSNCLAVYEFFRTEHRFFVMKIYTVLHLDPTFLRLKPDPIVSTIRPTWVCGIMSKLSSHCQKPKLRLGQNENFLSWTTARFLVLLRKVKHLYQFSLLKGKIL